ncbi:MAG: PQQ-like beta-propeller repeat protein, partial [Verrucomicrobia subdivision 3 bacterium]|nr:PQQ-like beta-propeller repeat protein [Limisphaerales bacterium]
PLKEVPISGLSFADFTFLDAGNRVFVLGSDSRLFTYDLATGNRETKLLQHPARYDNAHLSVTGATILVDHRVGRDREVLMWEHDVGMWKQMAFYRDISSFDTFVVSARGDTFVGCFTDVKSPPWTYPITFRHPLADDRIVMGRGTLSPITNIAIAPHGCFFLLVTRDGQLTFWDAIANCAVVHTDLGLSPVRAAVSPDARHVTVLFSTGEVKISKIEQWFSQDQVPAKSLSSFAADLGSSNPADANRAFFAFIGERKAAIKVLSDHLSRISPEKQDWKELASRLASDDFATRESAEGLLRDAGESALDELRKHQREHPSAEARWRLNRITEALTETPLSPRMKRAIAMLQSIAGPDASALLHNLQEHPSRAIRVEATRALELLGTRMPVPQRPVHR